MRIPYPERVPIQRVALFAVGLFVVQTIEGTALYFSAGCMAFIMLAGFAFNAGGGLARTAGAYVFFYSLLDVIIGLCYKAYLGEPAESNLRDPHTTIMVFAGGMAAMYAAVLVSRRIARKKSLLGQALKNEDMYRAAIGCIVMGLGANYVFAFLGQVGLILGRAFAQLNQLVTLAIIIGVMYEIRRSGGRRSLNGSVIVASLWIFVMFGLLSYSKQGLLTPLLCWALPVITMGFRLSKLNLIAVAAFIFAVFHYLTPYTQIGRSTDANAVTFSERVAASYDLLSHPERTRAEYERVQAPSVGANDVHYFSTPSGFWDRLQFISVDDSLIDVTDQGRVFGLSPIIYGFENAIPHFLWPGKPVMLYGNIYAHEVGGLPEDDTTTGISFSPTGEAYHMAKWFGVLVVAPLVWFLLFTAFDALLGDLRATPWGLLATVQIAHIAPEGAISGVLYLLTFGSEILIFCALFSSLFSTRLASVVLGRDKRKDFAQRAFEPILAQAQ